MEERQVVIIGSGPSGAACAKALIEEGMDVLVIEKAKLPRQKTCSGILFGQTQLLLGKFFGLQPPEEVYCEPRVIKAGNILEWHQNGRLSPYVWELPKDGESFPQEYHNVWRDKFDHWLMKVSGVECRDQCRLHSYVEQNGKIKVTLKPRGNGDARYLLCSHLIGADGANSRVRNILAPAGDEQSKDCLAYYGYYRFSDMGALQDGHWYVFLHPAFGDIIACVHRKDDLLAATVGGFKGCDIRGCRDRFMDFLAQQGGVGCAGRVMEKACTLRIRQICLGRGNVLLAGDAAGLIYLNGEGISAALDSGYRAGKAVAAAAKDGMDALTLYSENCVDILDHMRLCMDNAHFIVPRG